MDAKVVKLQFPIQAYGKDVSELTFSRRVNLGDIRATDGMGDGARMVRLVSRLAGIPESSAEQIDAFDLDAVGSVVGELSSDPFPRTGPT